MKRIRDVGAQLECLRELGSKVELGEDRSVRPLVVILFRRGNELWQFAPSYDGKPVKLQGLYQDGERRQFIAVDASLDALPHVVAHEYGHFLMGARERQYPLWLLEGLSENFAANATCESRSARKGAFGSQIKLTQLFSLRENSREYNEEDFHRQFYADASLATEYFWINSERKRDLQRYLELTRGGEPMEEAIRDSFHISGKELRRAIRDFAAQSVSPEVAARRCAGSTEMELLPVSDLDARADLAEFKAQVAGHLPEAIKDFEAILRESPGHPIALRGLAYASWKRGDTVSATTYFRLAAIADPADPLLPYLYAVMLRSQGADKDAVLRREMQSALRSSIALKSDFADAHHWLSLSYGWDAEFPAASQEAMKALELDPNNEQFKYNLAAFYARSQRRSEALLLCQELRSAADKNVASRAEVLSQELEGH